MLRPTPAATRPGGIARGLALALLAVLVLPAVGDAQSLDALRAQIARAHPQVRWVSGASLARWLARPVADRPILLDVRERDEYRVSQLRGARRVDPDHDAVSSLGLDRDALIVVYCSVGYRSAIMAERLHRGGFSRVYNLEGGIFAWANAGRPLSRGGRPALTVHPYDALWGRMLQARYRAQL